LKEREVLTFKGFILFLLLQNTETHCRKL